MIKLQGTMPEIQYFIGFIDYIFNQLNQYVKSQYIELLRTDEFKLFNYIMEDIKADSLYFFNLDFDNEFMGFIPVNRHIRISSEALIDLYNLIYVYEYKTVLQYMDERNKYRFNENFKKYYYKGDFTILSKLKIAKDNGFGNELDCLEHGMLKEINKYIHASVFIQPNFDYYKKLYDAKKLMLIELGICKKAIECLCAKYNFNFGTFICNYQIQPNPGAYSFEQVYIDCIGKIKNNMYFIDRPNPYIYNTQTVY